MRTVRDLLRGARTALLLVLATACASVETVEEETAAVPPIPSFVTASDLADSLGLTVEASPDGGRRDLVALDGARILLFPGTAVASVAGTRVDLSATVTESRGEVWLTREDAVAVHTAWMARPASWDPPVVRDVAPPPPPPVGGGPRPRAGVPSPTGAERPSPAERAAWSVKPRLRDWRYIVIHHSATAVGSASAIDRWHREKDWDGLGYHFVIGNGTGTPDGAVEVGFRWRQQREGAHAKTDGNFMNEHGIGICLVGDFNSTNPSPAQMRSLERLCRFLTEYCRVSPRNLRLHCDVKPTECPGRHFPRSFLASLITATGRTAADRDSDEATVHAR